MGRVLRVLMAVARELITFPGFPNSKGKIPRKLKQCHPLGLSPPETLAEQSIPPETASIPCCHRDKTGSGAQNPGTAS